MTPTNSPLNEDHLRQLNAALDAAKIAETQITLARQANIDVSRYEKDLQDSTSKILAIKRTYFPGR